MYTNENIMSVISSGMKFDSHEFIESMNELLANIPEWLTVVNLISTITVVVACIIYCKFIEKRSLASMGFRKRNALAEYLVGMLIATVLFFAVTFIGIVSGAFEFKGISLFSLPMIIFYFIGYIIQGASEEILIHGYLMTSVARKNDTFFALFISSLAFALLHFGNAGNGIIPFINIFLFGFMSGTYILKRGNIWGICAIHSVWNFIQGNVLGLSVSGMEKNSSIFAFNVKEGYDVVTGGQFGPEGGLIVTLVLLVGIGIVRTLKTNKYEISDIVFENEEKESV